MLPIQKQHLPFSFRPRTTVTLLSLRRHQCHLPTTRLSTTAAAAACSASRADPFAVEEYLVSTCHLTPAQALKASKVLSHLKSPSRPDAVLAFLSGLGLSDADIAAAVAYDPKLLCSEVERTLAPRLAELRDLGLSPSQIARLVLVDPARFRRPTVVSKLQYYVPLFGSFDNLLQAVRSNAYLLSSDLERVVKPNVAFLMECGLDACDIAKLSVPVPRLITTNPERVRAMVERAEAVGVPRGTGMFRHALLAVAFLSEEKIAAKVEFLKKTFRWSESEVAIAVSKLPLMLKHSKDRLRRMSEFLITQVGLEPEYIAHRPALLTYSLERRLMPRHYVVKFLKENGLLEQDRSYYTAVQVSENVFMEKFIHPYKEAAPSLAQDYAAACRGEVPTTLGFQEPCTGPASA
ncbi:transcription termination factor MTERF4, chloroplastic-like [Panicum hallii]|jgi:mTERF domain-containing protein, mitochondrial|uniref:transcription termination factor MTERF4, chloroplastic-like n=1 Tax=Panicum hallii TaxID=206008 RepID=UPI000DF4ECF5|nr:transcription termination factor MTERF4, chloroplastic-like [Panicum hallii]